jgi:hypothetical protein
MAVSVKILTLFPESRASTCAPNGHRSGSTVAAGSSK